MAAPTFNSAYTGATDAGGAWSYSTVTNAIINRFLVCQILQDGTTNGAVTFTGSSNVNNLAGSAGWTQVPGPNADGSWPVGSAEAARQFIFLGRVIASGSPVTISGGNSTSEDLYMCIYEFLSVSTGTTLATVIENGTAGSAANEAGTSGTIADADVTTLGSDRYPLQFIAINDDNTLGSNFSGGNLNFSLVTQYAEASGTDGAISLYAQHPSPNSAGTYGGGTLVNPDSADGWGVVGFALIGTTVEASTLVLEQGYVNFNDPGVL